MVVVSKMRVLGQKKPERGGAKRPPALSLFRIKGTVDVISIDPPLKEWDIQSTCGILEQLERYRCF